MTATTVLAESGFSSLGSKLTYVTLNKIAAVLDTFDTCANRIENHMYRISTYTENYSRLLDLTNDIENILDKSTLQVQNRRILSVHFANKLIEELSPGLYMSQLTYEIIAQKDFSLTKYKLDKEDETLYQKLIRYLPRQLNFITTKYGHESWERPFLSVPNFISNDDFRTTKSRQESYDFDICCEAFNPLEVEDILEDVDNILSYSTVSWKNRRFTTLQWQGSTLEEIEPELWQGKIKYKLLVEKDL